MTVPITDAQRRLLALCAIRLDGTTPDWPLLARTALRPRGLDELEAARVGEKSTAAAATQRLLETGLREPDRWFERVDEEVALADKIGARLVTVLDEDYPLNLRLIYNLPPFLFLRGQPLLDVDLRSVAVVGTRQPSDRGIERATSLARGLVEAGVVVVSGLARGIDTAAHRSTLDAGGRTIAVMGTGITRTYPAENQELAERIATSGVLVSQFWPSSAPARWTFPRRNVVMSGIAQGTVVVEASSTSGARMQARFAIEHGKRVFLLRSLVTSQPWAQKFVRDRGAIEAASVEEILSHLAAPERIRDVTSARQLTLDLP